MEGNRASRERRLHRVAIAFLAKPPSKAAVNRTPTAAVEIELGKNG